MRHKSREEVEARKMRAFELFEDGLKCSQVVRRLGITSTTASKWLKEWEKKELTGETK